MLRPRKAVTGIIGWTARLGVSAGIWGLKAGRCDARGESTSQGRAPAPPRAVATDCTNTGSGWIAPNRRPLRCRPQRPEPPRTYQRHCPRGGRACRASGAAMDRGPVSMSNSYAEEQSPTDLHRGLARRNAADMAHPDLGRAGGCRASSSVPISFAQLTAAFAAVLGLAASSSASFCATVLPAHSARPSWKTDGARRRARLAATNGFFRRSPKRPGEPRNRRTRRSTQRHHRGVIRRPTSRQACEGYHEMQQRQRHGAERHGFKPPSRHVPA